MHWPKCVPKLHEHVLENTSYHTIKLHLKHAFQSVYRHELETKLPPKPWKQKITKIPDWARRKAVAQFRLCVGHDWEHVFTALESALFLLHAMQSPRTHGQKPFRAMYRAI